jgi:ribosomal protein S18 acetylase RimI-like enzyme
MFKKIIYKENKLIFIENLKKFLNENELFLDNFRYYQNRKFNVLENHIYSSIYLSDDNSVVGYGHLDNEENKIWLGIAISNDKRGFGYGNLIIDDLLKQYTDEIHLTVDIENNTAINLYKKKNFNILKENNKFYLMKKEKWDIH